MEQSFAKRAEAGNAEPSLQTFSPSQDDKICVVIPMYRVEPYIKAVISGIPEWVWRVIVVDDCSPDQSAEAACETNDPRLVLVRHSQNQGVGGAMLTGFNKAMELGAQVAVKMDGDGQMAPEFLADMVEPILAGRADYTKGNRFFHVREISAMPLSRRIGNLGLSFLAKLASGYWNVFDPTNGYLAINLCTFSNLEQASIHRRYYFEISLLVELNLARAVVTEIPMPAIYAGETSSLSVMHSLLEFSIKLMKSLLRRLWLQYFVLDFSLGSLFLVTGPLMCLFGTGWGLYYWNKSILTGVSASTGTVMIAVLPVILGFQILLQFLTYDIQNIPKTVQRRRLNHRGTQ